MNGEQSRGERLRDAYVDSLLDRITEVRYPSLELVDRAENIVYKREQAERLVVYLISLIDNVRYPSSRGGAACRRRRWPPSLLQPLPQTLASPTGDRR
jgi:hypothetical protein